MKEKPKEPEKCFEVVQRLMKTARSKQVNRKHYYAMKQAWQELAFDGDLVQWKALRFDLLGA